MRELAACSITLWVAACNFGEHIAEAPVDSTTTGDGTDIDAGDNTPDAPGGDPPCEGTTDGDGDNIPDCTEQDDGDPATDPAIVNGLHAVIGRAPEVSGSCKWLESWDEVKHELGTIKREQDISAGWSFDTMANRYDDASYGFAPNWPAAEGGRFNIVYRGKVFLTAGQHCFAVDIGAAGSDSASNRCAQIYVSIGARATSALAQTGFEAPANAAVNCVDMTADGTAPIDIVYRNFHLALPPITHPHNKLDVRHCAGVACTPTTTLPATMLQATPDPL
jgi:hypothetical protein